MSAPISFQTAVTLQQSGGVGKGAPTAAQPGSETKQAVIAARARAKLPLFHYADPGEPSELDLAFLLLPGVRLVQKKTARYRALPSDPKNWYRHVHLGYFPTRAEAALEILLWIRAGKPDAKAWRASRSAQRKQS